MHFTQSRRPSDGRRLPRCGIFTSQSKLILDSTLTSQSYFSATNAVLSDTMAHKELITQYAKQLTEANQRIIDLEVNIADVRSELDKANASENHPRDDDKKEIERLRKELAAKEGATEDLRNATKHTSEQPVDIEDAPPAGEIERSDEDESKKARERIVELELAIQSKSKKIANVKKRVGNDQKELRTRGEKIAELEEQIKDVNARNRVLGGEKGRLTARVNWLTGMKEQAAESRQKATELQAQVDDLNKQLNQEGKRK